MRVLKQTLVRATSFLLGLSACPVALARNVPEPMDPPRNFATSQERFDVLYRLHKGGTAHTCETVPKWEGLWSAGNGARGAFLEEGEIVEGVLTPAHEGAFSLRLDLIEERGEQGHDRLTTCEPAGYPRFLLESYVRKLINTPYQSWQLNDLTNENRRVFEQWRQWIEMGFTSRAEAEEHLGLDPDEADGGSQ